MNLERIAADILACAITHEPGVRLMGNVRADDIARLAAHHIDTCPKCGATAWVNIDCDLCTACHELLSDKPSGQAPRIEPETKR